MTVTLLNRKMAVLLLLIISLLSYSDRHFASTFHPVELPTCNVFFFPSELIIFALSVNGEVLSSLGSLYFLSSGLFYKYLFSLK